MSVSHPFLTEHSTPHTAAVTPAPTSESDAAADIGAVLVVTFLVAVTVAAFNHVLAPVAKVGRTLMGTAGAVLLTFAAFVLLSILMVT
jgi:hypothetical protein